MILTLTELLDIWAKKDFDYYITTLKYWRYADRGYDYYWASLSREWTIGKSVNMLDLLQEGQWK